MTRPSVVGWALLGGALAGGPALGASEGVPADSVEVLTRREVVRPVVDPPFRPSPGGAFRRSMVLPGWGQLYNRRPVKALLFAVGRGYLGWRAYDEHQLAEDLEDEALAITDDEAARNRRWRERNRALDRRDDFLWWSLYSLFFTATEAFVDAYLMDFDDEFEGIREVTPDGETIRMGLRVRY
jgi:hypothetical protein